MGWRDEGVSDERGGVFLPSSGLDGLLEEPPEGPMLLLPHWSTALREMPKASVWTDLAIGYKKPYSLDRPTSVCDNVHVTKSGCMLMPLSSGKARLIKPGHAGDYDHIILANGYCPQSFPFLKELELNNSTEKQRYHLTFATKHPNVAVIGFWCGQVGALTSLMEMQARWFALVVSGQRRLPTYERMEDRIEFVKSVVRGKYAIRTPWMAANYIAKHEVLCQANLWTLALKHPFVVYNILTSSFASWQFRQVGP